MRSFFIGVLGAQPYQRPPSASLIFWSVLYWLSAEAAQIAAGTQPINVICRSKHSRPAKGRPMVKNTEKGKSKASSRRMAERGENQKKSTTKVAI
jgi:hypothetical protein